MQTLSETLVGQPLVGSQFVVLPGEPACSDCDSQRRYFVVRPDPGLADEALARRAELLAAGVPNR